MGSSWTASTSSGPTTRATATSRPTWPSPTPGSFGGTRGRWRRASWGRWTRRSCGRPGSRDPGSSTSGSPRRRSGTGSARCCARVMRTDGGRLRGIPSCSSSSAPTPRGPCTSRTGGRRPTGTRWPGSWRPRAGTSRASTTSTMGETRSGSSASRSPRATRGSAARSGPSSDPETLYKGEYMEEIARGPRQRARPAPAGDG